jgi:PKD repeat protein
MRFFTIGRLVVITGLLVLFGLAASAQDVVYLRTNLFGNYWGRNGNATALNRAFGTNGWTRRYFENADIAELFGPDHKVIFVDGSNMGTCDLISFFTQYQAEFEAYVDRGGALFINAAASECTDSPIDFGFAGVTSVFMQDFDGFPVDPGHPIFNGPRTPALADMFSGSNLSHNIVSGGGLTALLNDSQGNLVLGEKLWGSGLVLFGGLTLEWIGENSLWAPEPEISNLYDNILLYLYAHATGGECTDSPVVITQDILVALDDSGQATIEASQIDNGSSSACGDITLALDITQFSCSNVGQNTVTLTVTDVNGVAASGTGIVTIEDVTPPMVITQDIVVQLDATGKASITAAEVNNGSNDACGIASMALDISDFTCDHVGTNEITLTVTDNNGNMAAGTAIATVENDVPVILSIGPDSDDPVKVKEEITASATYEDINLTSAIWDWGDGTTSEGVFSEGEITGVHTYLEPGVYTLSLLLEDICGLQTTDYYDYIIVVDPDGGFVTGGGRFSSPTGAWLDDAQVSGGMKFAFVAKYRKHRDRPVGSTVFKFKKAHIKFKSKKYDWLVVNESIAMYQGTGKIRKDRNHYRFQVSVVDDGHGRKGQDKFRLQMWQIESGALVYDNQLGDAENAIATNTIDRGDIVIHNYKKYLGHNSDDDDEDDDKKGGKKSDSEDRSQPSVTVKLALYPNPVARVLHVKIENDISDYNSWLRISTVDSRGRRKVLVNRQTITGPDVFEYDLSGFKNGIYYLVVEGDNIIKSTRFIKY